MPYRASTNGNLNAYGGSDLNHQLMIGGFDLDLSTGGDSQKDNSFYEQAWDENLLAAPFYIDLGSNADPANLFDPWVLSSTNTTPLLALAWRQTQLAYAPFHKRHASRPIPPGSTKVARGQQNA